MIEEIFCVARDPIQAGGLLRKIESMGIPSRSVVIATLPSEVEHAVYPDSQILRDATRGFMFGAVAGWFLSTAILTMIGTSTVHVSEALLLLMGGGAGGAVLGTVFAASGVFGTEVMASSLEQHYAEEVGRGGILISVELRGEAQRNAVMAAITDSGASDIHELSEIAA